MPVTDELRKLADLHRSGQLTDEEFTSAKRKLLAEANPPASASSAVVEVAADFEPQTYRSSHWSSGNLFFADSLTLARDGIVFRKGRLFGSSEEHINYRAIASIRVKNGLCLSNLTVETSGGTQPISINGLWRSDARAIQDTIRLFQT